MFTVQQNVFISCPADPPPGGGGSLYLDLLQLLLVGGVHLLQGLLQLMVPVQEGFSQLCRQMEICASGGKYVNKRYEAACMPKHRLRIQIYACKATVTSHGRPHGKYLA